MFGFEFQGGALDAGGGIVDEYVERAEFACDRLEELGYLVFVAEVGADAKASDAERLYLLFRFGGGSVVSEVVEGYVGASGGEFQRDGFAYAARAAGYERGLAVESQRAHLR